MATKEHEITKYNYSFNAGTGGPERLQLWSKEKSIADIRFVDDDTSVPAPTFTTDLESAVAFFRQGSLLALIDLLRNESPVFVTINDQPPGFVFIHTGLEPVGVGEAHETPAPPA